MTAVAGGVGPLAHGIETGHGLDVKTVINGIDISQNIGHRAQRRQGDKAVHFQRREDFGQIGVLADPNPVTQCQIDYFLGVPTESAGRNAGCGDIRLTVILKGDSAGADRWFNRFSH